MASTDLQTSTSPELLRKHLYNSLDRAEALSPASPCYAKAFEQSEVATFEPLKDCHKHTDAPEKEHLLHSSITILKAMPGSDCAAAAIPQLPGVFQPQGAVEGVEELLGGSNLPLPQPIGLPDEVELQEKGQLAEYFGVDWRPERCFLLLITMVVEAKKDQLHAA